MENMAAWPRLGQEYGPAHHQEMRGRGEMVAVLIMQSVQNTKTAVF
jgi:hypothetical protein